jgi:hypothetical protein
MANLNSCEGGELNRGILVRLAQLKVENSTFPAEDFYGCKAPAPSDLLVFV